MALTKANLHHLSHSIKQLGKNLGFQAIGITDINLTYYERPFLEWLAKGFHGEMHYMAKHGLRRLRPQDLVPNTIRLISARLDYLPPDAQSTPTLHDPYKGYIARYALGRDYHRLIRKRLALLAQRISALTRPFGSFRVFCDSAPVLEKPIAAQAGLGWIGKHTNLINAKAGSWFFLGEIYTDVPLPIDAPTTQSHCGSCTACMKACPTGAIIAPYQLDARRCISYLTIELRSAIPLALRPMIGNRIFGCDDCQLVCPWNKFAKYTNEPDFHPRHNLHRPQLLDLFAWTEADFLQKTEGSAIRRIGHACWLRNIAVALGNAPYHPDIVSALQKRLPSVPAMVRDHIVWALARQRQQAP